jgi:hypothetical protein
MYQFSRAIYRELQHDIIGGSAGHAAVVRACEENVERLVHDRHYFARPARTLYHDLRPWFGLHAHPRVWQVVQRYVAAAELAIEQLPRGLDPNGMPLQCRATTRRGTPCQRMPLAHNGWCPSHQHLAETEDVEVAAAA